jgi:hypothetical protein
MNRRCRPNARYGSHPRTRIAILALRRLFQKKSDQKRLEQDDINQY